MAAEGAYQGQIAPREAGDGESAVTARSSLLDVPVETRSFAEFPDAPLQRIKWVPFALGTESEVGVGRRVRVGMGEEVSAGDRFSL